MQRKQKRLDIQEQTVIGADDADFPGG